MEHVCVVIGRTRHKMVQVEIQEAAKRGARLIELRLDFLAKAPAEVVAKEKEKVQGWTEKLTKLKNHRERIKELMG